MQTRRVMFCLATLLLVGAGLAARWAIVRAQSAGAISLVSRNTAGDPGNADSQKASVSADGGYIAFQSRADNLVAGVSEGRLHVYLRDHQDGTTTLVSRHSDGTPGNSGSYFPSISGDGRFVAFVSDATNLVANDDNLRADIFLYDRDTGAVQLISRHSDGTLGNGDSNRPAVSGDGNFVAYQSWSTNLIDNDSNGVSDIFVWERATGQTTLVSRVTDGTLGDGESTTPSISASGRFIAFDSSATNLSTIDEDAAVDIFVHDRDSGQTVLVSRNGSVAGNDESNSPAISADGRYVAFDSQSSNLSAGDTNDAADVFVHTLDTGLTTLVSRRSDGSSGSGESLVPTLSGDGRLVAFESTAGDLVAADSNGATSDIFVSDWQAGSTVLASRRADGTQSAEGSYEAAIAAGGDVIVFESGAGDLVTDDTNSVYDVFRREVTAASRLTFYPVADAYVYATYPTRNFGGQTTLRVRDAATDMNAYLKFDIDGLDCADVLSAAVRLYATDGGPDAGGAYAVADDWTETSITWGNAPPIGPVALDSPGAAVAGQWLAFNVTGAVAGNGPVSFAIANDSTNVVIYNSRESTRPPELVVDYLPLPAGEPVAAFTAEPVAGPAPLTVQFRDTSGGCPTEWLWDFGDGGTAMEANPVHTYGAPGDYAVSLTVTNAAGSDEALQTGLISVELPPPAEYLFASPAGSGNAGGVPFAPADILRYDETAGEWTVYYDGSDVKASKNLSALAFLADGDLLLSWQANQPIAGQATFMTQDIARFSQTQPGDPTTGIFSCYFDGSDVGLTTSGENIDALWVMDDGRLLLSTTGTAKVNKLDGALITAHDEDILAFEPSAPGCGETSGEWELFFDGTPVTGLKGEDINGLWLDESSGDLYVTILGAFNLGGVRGDSKDIVRLTTNTTVPGGWSAELYLDGSLLGFPTNLDALARPRP